jgi:hypothetical protein
MRQRRRTIRATIDVPRFFFFIGLLFGNPDWDDVVFDAENDRFTYNLHLIPLALEHIISLISDISPQFDESSLRNACVTFFSTVGAIAGQKREKKRDLFAPFVILVDHCASMSKAAGFGYIEHAFPFAVIRACYGDLADRESQESATARA